MRRLAQALAPEPGRAVTQLGSIGELWAGEPEGRRLSIDAELLTDADIGSLRHWLNRGFARELYIWGLDADSTHVRALALEPGARFLAWPPDAEQLERLREDAPRRSALWELGEAWARLCRQLTDSRSGLAAPQRALGSFLQGVEDALDGRVQLPPAPLKASRVDLKPLIEDCFVSASLASARAPRFQLSCRGPLDVLAPEDALRDAIEDICRLALLLAPPNSELRARLAGERGSARRRRLRLALPEGPLGACNATELLAADVAPGALGELLERMGRSSGALEAVGGHLLLRHERPGRLLCQLTLLAPGAFASDDGD